jgi:sigma-B regulation protein RsbU (phosphoserine phosphatase)
MDSALMTGIQNQLLNRRALLKRLTSEAEAPQDLVLLLDQVDRALRRLANHHYGDCDVCGGRFDDTELLENPLATYCLCRLSEAQQRMLEHDLELAWRIQASLLPPPLISAAGWDAHYRYQPLGAVSGDYCDLVATEAHGHAWLYFAMGDVSGKGIAAALLMSHLSATVRSLARAGADLRELAAEANRTLRRHSPESHYMTMALGRTWAGGQVELLNAGHCAPIVIADHATAIETPAGPPLGLFDLEHPAAHQITELEMKPGQSLLLYTDGLTEAFDRTDEEYGIDRLNRLAGGMSGTDPISLVSACLKDVGAFLDGAPRTDDLAILALRRSN